MLHDIRHIGNLFEGWFSVTEKLQSKISIYKFLSNDGVKNLQLDKNSSKTAYLSLGMVIGLVESVYRVGAPNQSKNSYKCMFAVIIMFLRII